MNEIKITLTIPGISEAINNLAEAIREKSDKPIQAIGTVDAQQTVTPRVNPTVVPLPLTNDANTANAQPVNLASVNPAMVAQNGPTPTPYHSNPAPTAPTVPAAPTPATNYTIEQISIAGAALCEQGKMPELIALLGKYGVQAVTQLDNATAETINAFATDLKALGANL